MGALPLPYRGDIGASWSVPRRHGLVVAEIAGCAVRHPGRRQPTTCRVEVVITRQGRVKCPPRSKGPRERLTRGEGGKRSPARIRRRNFIPDPTAPPRPARRRALAAAAVSEHAVVVTQIPPFRSVGMGPN